MSHLAWNEDQQFGRGQCLSIRLDCFPPRSQLRRRASAPRKQQPQPAADPVHSGGRAGGMRPDVGSTLKCGRECRDLRVGRPHNAPTTRLPGIAARYPTRQTTGAGGRWTPSTPFRWRPADTGRGGVLGTLSAACHSGYFGDPTLDFLSGAAVTVL